MLDYPSVYLNSVICNNYNDLEAMWQCSKWKYDMDKHIPLEVTTLKCFFLCVFSIMH